MQTIINANKSLSSKCIQYEYEFDYNVTTNPLSIDTEEDFLEVKKEMESND